MTITNERLDELERDVGPGVGNSEVIYMARELKALRETRRWNIAQVGDVLEVCRGDHDRSAGCEPERYVREIELLKLRERYRWIPVTERLPSDGFVQVFIPGNAGHQKIDVWPVSDFIWWHTNHPGIHVTHWRELDLPEGV